MISSCHVTALVNQGKSALRSNETAFLTPLLPVQRHDLKKIGVIIVTIIITQLLNIIIYNLTIVFIDNRINFYCHVYKWSWFWQSLPVKILLFRHTDVTRYAITANISHTTIFCATALVRSSVLFERRSFKQKR